MITNRERGLEDYLAMAGRHLWLILIPTVVAPLIGFLISYTLTPKYTSTSLLLVQGQVVPSGYVKPIVTERVSDRMIELQQNVLSRNRLQPLVSRLGLARKGKSEDQWIDEIRDNVQVHKAELNKSSSAVPGESGPGGTADVSGFFVSFTTDNPRDAQQVCAEITSLILAENLEVREQIAKSTTDFLTRQVEQSKHNLDEQDRQLSEFKHQHLGQMPGDLDSNLKILAGLNSQLDSMTQQVGRIDQDKSRAETQLAQVLEVWKASQASPNYGALRDQLIKLQNQLVILQARYTDDYPDVIKTKHLIADLQNKLKDINKDPEASGLSKEDSVPRAGPRLEPPEIVRLREQIRHDDTAMERLILGQKKVQAQIDLYQSRLTQSPEIEDEWKTLTRDNATAHNIYNELLTNESTAEIQTEMERFQEGEQLKLLNPASLPGTPSFPKRSMFALYGLGAGLGIGLLGAGWLEFRDKSIRDEGDVVAALELPMLGSMPWLGTEIDSKSRTGGLGRALVPRFEGEKTA